MKPTRILLIHTEETRTHFNALGIVENEPLETEILYTVLKQAGYQVRIYDPDREPACFEELLSSFAPDLVYADGVVKQVPYMLDYMQRTKAFSQKNATILGGVFAEHNYRSLYKDTVDYISRSYDPFVISALAALLSEQDFPSSLLENLNGLCYRSEDGSWTENTIHPFDINLLPRDIDRSHFYQYQSRFRLLKHNPLACVRFAYSCSHKCTFCYRTMMNCGRYVHKDVRNFAEEIRNIQCDNIYIIDDNFLVDPTTLSQFTAAIRELKINKNFICYGRCDFILKNKDLIKELTQIGFRYFIVGFEAVRDNYLQKYDKKIEVDDSLSCIHFMKSIHAGLYAMMIIDTDFTPADFTSMYRWVKEQQLEYVIPSIITPLPGTQMYDDCKEKLLTTDWRKWDYTHVLLPPAHMSIPAFYIRYQLLVLRLFFLARRYGSYDFINAPSLISRFLLSR